MNIWHMQIHPNDNSWPMEKIKELVETKSVIGMGDTWENDRHAPQRFKEEVKIGDVFIIRHGGSPRYLVEIISECKENNGNDIIDAWFEIYRNIRVLSKEGPLYKDNYYKKYNEPWSSGIYAPITFENANNWSFANYWYNQIKKSKEMNQYIQLLNSNYNLILSGAPGTGKTFLAKLIAAQIILGKEYDEKTASEEEKNKMKEQCGFVQFHPSFDYTDFVEGLRPIQDENRNVGFERRDGVFKTFCERALKSSFANGSDNFDEVWDKLISYLDKNPFIEIPLLTNARNIRIELNESGTGLTERMYSDNNASGEIEKVRGHSIFFTKEQLYNVYRGLKGVPSGGHDNYRKAIIEYLKKNMGLVDYSAGQHGDDDKKFVFIIDEINRGDISKIFGELFFSIDPGYRGVDGAVRTQYANMQTSPNEFDLVLGKADSSNCGHFFVPKNIYIIGTMNDIDRSVESMDFAFRRRFAFVEVHAEKRVDMIKENQELQSHFDTIEERMENLNLAILTIQNLSTAYQIGAAYYLKLKNYLNDGGIDKDSWKKLWDNHLLGLLFEYLRGQPNEKEDLNTLQRAYNLEDRYQMKDGKPEKIN